ncbi:MAG: hypothetical protein ACR2PL_23645 [Dehalococcoidia bacterium]
MTLETLEALAQGVKTVLCPRCGLSCSLMPLRRPGAYRLVDPDGHGHTAVCIASVEPIQPPVRYRPAAPARPTLPASRPLAVSARRA